MTYEELLDEITAYERRTCNSAQDDSTCASLHPLAIALRAVVELHKPQDITLPDGSWGENCIICDGWQYPCGTIQKIMDELK